MSEVPTRGDGDWADRREHPRFDTRVQCSLRDAADPSLSAVMMRNLSLGGCFVLTPAPQPELHPVELHLTLPELERTVILSGVVAWQKLGSPGAGMGVRFTAVDPDDLALLRVYLNELAKEADLDA